MAGDIAHNFRIVADPGQDGIRGLHIKPRHEIKDWATLHDIVRTMGYHHEAADPLMALGISPGGEGDDLGLKVASRLRTLRSLMSFTKGWSPEELELAHAAEATLENHGVYLMEHAPTLENERDSAARHGVALWKALAPETLAYLMGVLAGATFATSLGPGWSDIVE